MPHSTLFFAAILSSATTFAAAQDTILSCADVKCPTFPNRATNDCKITSNSYSNVGVSKIPTPPSSFSGLTWVEAIAVDDSNKQRRFVKDFYLGSDPNTKADGTGACALFFTKVSNNVAFNDPTRDITTDQGTCAQAMSQDCVDKLLQRARAVDLEGLSGGDACSQLRSVFEGKIDTECASFAAGTAWSGVEAKGARYHSGNLCRVIMLILGAELIGSGAPSSIASSQNASTNCWPIEPKSYNLTPITSIVTNVCSFLITCL